MRSRLLATIALLCVLAPSAAFSQGVRPYQLEATDSPSDTEVPTYDSASGKFTWAAQAVGTGDITDVFDCNNGDCADVVVGATDSLDFSAIDANAAGEGLVLPQTTSCGGTGIATGAICYGTTSDELCVWDGAAWDCQVLGAAASGDITDVFNCSNGDCADVAMGATDSLDASAIDGNGTGEGIILPQTTACSSTNADSGSICYSTTADSLCVYDGSGYDCQVLGVTDTNANTICSGSTTYLDGDGNCDDISAVYLTAETNDLETQDPANIAANEFYIGTGTGAGQFIALSGAVTVAGATGIATLGNDVVGTANMADADHGDVAWSSGTATVQSIGTVAITLGTLTDGQYCTYTASGTVLNCNSTPGGTGDITDVFDCSNGDCADIAAGATDSLSFAAIDANATGEGLILPQTATCAGTGYDPGAVCYDTGTDSLCVGDGAAWDCQVLGVTQVTDTNANTICSGSTTYLDGDGNCDDISGVYLTAEANDLEAQDPANITANEIYIGTGAGAGQFIALSGAVTVNGSTGVATLGNDVVGTANVADADFGDFTCTNGDCALNADVVAAAEMADADHGDVSWSSGTATVDSGAVLLDEIGNPSGSKAFTMANSSLAFNYTAPTAEGFTIEASGGFTGDLLHLHQTTGNPGAGTDLAHMEFDDADVTGIRITGPSTSAAAITIAGGIISTNSQIQSSLATGTAPLTVASTTMVTNLNAEFFEDVAFGTKNDDSVCVLDTTPSPDVLNCTSGFPTEVVDEAYSAANFDAGTASGVSQDDFYDFNHIHDTDDDGLPNKVDLGECADDGDKLETDASGVLSCGAVVHPTEVEDGTTPSTGWNGDTTNAPSENDLYDFIVLGDTDMDGKANRIDLGVCNGDSEKLETDANGELSCGSIPAGSFNASTVTGNQSWSNGTSDASIAWTMNLNAGTDPVTTYSNNNVDFSTPVSASTFTSDDQAAATGGNSIYVLDNDSTNVPSGAAGQLTWGDIDGTATDKWCAYVDTTKQFCYPAPSATATQALFATATSGEPAFRAIADGDIPDTHAHDTGATGATAAADDNDTSLATTAFVQQEIEDAANDGRSLTGAATGVINADLELYRDTKCIVIENPDAADDFLFFRAESAITVTGIDCLTTTGTVNTVVNECDGNGGTCSAIEASIGCTTTNTPESAGIDNATVDAGDWVRVQIDSTVTTQMNVCVTFTWDD